MSGSFGPPPERYSVRLNRHSRESGNPAGPTRRLLWTPAFAGVTGNASIPLDASRRQLPADPVADRAAHHQFEVAAFEKRHLVFEHRDALPPRAWHAGDVGGPEGALWTERIEDLLGVFVDVAVGVGLARIARRAGRLDRDVGVFGEREERPLVAMRRIVARIPHARVMVEQQAQPGMSLGDLADLRQVVRRHQRDRDPGLLT